MLLDGDGGAIRQWLEPYAKALGAEVLLSDDNNSYSVATAELGLSQQRCIAHMRKYVTKRASSSTSRPIKGWNEQDEKLKADLRELNKLLEEHPEEGVNGSGGCIENTCGLLRPGGRARRRRRPQPLTG